MIGKNNKLRADYPDLVATEDHIVPKSKRGGRGDNIVLACYKCNQEKDSMSESEFKLLKGPAKP